MENKDIEKLTKLAEQGDATAIRELADYYYEEENYKNALDLYLKLAEQNDSDVLLRIGFCYHSLKDDKKAFELFLKSANLGNSKALFNIGICYNNAIGVEKDPKKAVEWYTKAAEQGHMSAQFNLANCYYKGNGVEKNLKKSAEWYTKAAEQGKSEAQHNLGLCYEKGDGVEQDLKKAVEWYNKAAEQGDKKAKEKLNDLYEKGLLILDDSPRCNDADFGEIVYAGINRWRGQTTANFYDKETTLVIELEGSENDKVTDAQHKAYAEYLEKKDAFFEAMIAKAKETYKGANNKKKNKIVPNKLYIDRDGNYGWVCSTDWEEYGKSVILSDGDVQLATPDIVYKYREMIASRAKTEWHVNDTAYMNLFGELQMFRVRRANYEFEEDDDEEIRNGKLTDREVELLLWLTTELNTADIADSVVEYCNDIYDMWCEKKIKANQLLDELSLSIIYLKTQFSAKYTDDPDISLAGECECDEEHGIAIGFRDKKFLSIGSEDYGF